MVVRETLGGFRERIKGRLIAVFEPRSATASRALHQEVYPDAFAPADITILAPVGRGEVAESERLDTAAIADAIRQTGAEALACTSVDEAIEEAIRHATPGDTIVVMSNGRFQDAPDRVLLGTGYTPRRRTG